MAMIAIAIKSSFPDDEAIAADVRMQLDFHKSFFIRVLSFPQLNFFSKMFWERFDSPALYQFVQLSSFHNSEHLHLNRWLHNAEIVHLFQNSEHEGFIFLLRVA